MIYVTEEEHEPLEFSYLWKKNSVAEELSRSFTLVRLAMLTLHKFCYKYKTCIPHFE